MSRNVFSKNVQAAVAVSRETKRKIAQGKAVFPRLLLVISSCTLVFVGKV